MQVWRRLRGKESPSQPVTASLAIKSSNHQRIQIGWATDIGQVRGHNEDALLITEIYQEGGQTLPPLGLFILADGMGGHRYGEVASAMAARKVAAHVMQQIYVRALSEQEHGAFQPSLNQVLTEAVNHANSAVAAAVQGGGTTLTCALVMGNRAYIAHVGDSRAYLVSADRRELEQITRDHSLVDRLIELGQLTADEAASHPQKNILYRAVGQSGKLEVDTYPRSIPPRCSLLLCSDGLWGMVSDEQMSRIIAASNSPQIACEALIDAANAAGGKDNISAILIELPAE